MSPSGSLFDGIKAIIFDFDGVILESGNIKTEAFLDLFAEYPQHQSAILDYHLENLGVSRFDKFEWIYQKLLGQSLHDDEKKRLGEAFSSIVIEKIMRCPFVPGALEVLKKYQGMYLKFIASGTPHEELEFIVKQREISEYFDGIWGTPRLKPQIVRTILRQFELGHDEVLFVGDGISDYKAAHEVGIPFVARETPELCERWRELGAMCVADMNELSAQL